MKLTSAHALLLIVFLEGICQGIYLPILPFVILEFGGGPIEVTLIVAVFAVCGFLSSPLIGSASDRFGRRLILSATMVLALFAFAGLVVSSTLVALFVLRAIGGFASGKQRH